ncbi:hypothetical protein PUR71_04725 [Streptomyces sp. SP17BM10]|uniref:effector-associated constant component EACC1 n=1 Tax=Streptomyces sp. SP17BM10 TaxID=3002530 RepID=UPI002E790584|nr:hypothetical protein [Streptomyces sp. SP17BM10]MEE1782233.1 hypothetical protein [Streptomyces sp. SP17BM10]
MSAGRAEVSVSDPGELRPLRKHLRRVPGLEVEETDAAAAAGRTGAACALRVLAVGRGALGRAVRTLPAFLRTRRGAVSVTVRTLDWTVTLHPERSTAGGPTVTELAAALRALRAARDAREEAREARDARA